MVAEGFRLLISLKSLSLDLDAMLICTCREEDIVTLEAVIPSHRVAEDRSVEVADVRLSIDIEDWRGYNNTLFLMGDAKGTGDQWQELSCIVVHG